VDAEGRVAGINTSGFGHGAAVTIPADLAWSAARQLADHGSIKRGYLGVRSEAVEIPAPAQKALKRKQASGLLVISVERGSPAESGGLMVGDILVGVDGAAVPDHDALFARLTGEAVGRSLPVEVLRGGQPKTLPIEIGPRP
jgi:S1-C subfamily serine protease